MSTRESNVRLRIEAISSLPEVAEQYTELIKLAREHAEATKQAANIIKQAIADEGAATRAQTTELKAQEAAQKSAAATARQAATEAKAAAKEAADELKRQTAAQQALADAERATAVQARAAAIAQRGDIKGVGDQLDQANQSVRNFTTLLAAAFTFSAVKQFGNEVIEAKTKVDSIQIALTTLLGSRREADDLYAKVITLAKSTPFSLEEVSDQVLKLKAYNIATEDLIPTITALGNMAAAVGKEKLPQLTLAYGQIANTGKLMGTELKQLTEAGIPAMDLLAVSMGKTKDEVVKLQAAHQISFADIRKAFLSASEEGGRYAGLMANVSKTVGGQISNLGDAYQVAKARIGDFFESQIKSGTKYMGELIETLIGSESAIRKTTLAIGSAVTVFATFRVASTAQALATAAVTAAQAAGALTAGTYNLVMLTLKGSTEGFTRAQLESAVAARSTYATIAANPIGALVTVIGLATAAYMAWKVAQDDVSVSMGQQEFDLRKSQDEMNRLVDVATSLHQTDTRRKGAIQDLIAKYPEYFAGINSEKITNDQLRSILDGVNKSYTSRIELAKEAYNTEKRSEQQRKLWDEESAAIDKLVSRVPELKQFGNDYSKIIDYLNHNMEAFKKSRNSAFDIYDNARGYDPLDQLRQVQGSLKKLADEQIAGDERVRQVTTQGREIDIKNTHDHYAGLIKAAGDNKAEIARLKEQENDAVAKINGTYRAKELTDTVNHASEMKTIHVLSANQMASLIKGAYAETLTEQIAALRAQEKEERDAANTRVVNKKISGEQLAEIERQTREQVLAIHQEYEGKIQALRDQAISDLMVDSTEFVSIEAEAAAAVTNLNTETAKQKAKAIKDANKEIIKDNRELVQEAKALDTETRQLDAETTQIQISSKKQLYSMAIDLIGQQSGLLGELGQSAKALYMNWDALSGKTKAAAEERYASARQSLNDFKALYDENSAADLKKLAELENAAAQAKNTVAKTTAETNAATLSMYATAFNIAVAITKAVGDAIAQTYLTVADALQKTRDVYSYYFDQIHEIQAQALATDLEYYRNDFAKREELVKSYYDNERMMAQSRDVLDAELAKAQGIVEAKSHVFDTMTQYQRRMAEVEQQYQQRHYEALIHQGELDREEAKKTLDLRLEKIAAEFDAFKAAKDKEIAEEEKAFDKRKQLNEQFYSDKQLRLQEDDTYRNQLLQQGEAREIKALEEAKAREIDRATKLNASAEEIARITNAFNKLIADKHAEYSDAIGNKAKETSLANVEAKNQEKDEVDKLEATSKNTITKLQDEITAKEKQSAQERKKANFDYKIAVMQANSEIWEATKAAKIAELQAEIAILQSKRNFLNAGKINAAIDQIEGAINRVSGLSLSVQVNMNEYLEANDLNQRGNPKQPITLNGRGVLNFPVFDKAGNPIEITYKDSGDVHTVYDADGNEVPIMQASGFIPKTGERFFQGTEFVQGLGLPDGIDTVPAMLTKGERVLTADQNAALKGVTNEQVVKRVKYFDILQAQFPDRLDPARWADIANSTMRLPEGIMKAPTIDMNRMVDEMQGFRNDLKDVKRAIETKKETHISLDKSGYSAFTLGVQSKIKHKETVFRD